MRIDFEDGSFLAIHPSNNDSRQLILVTCGRKDRNTTTMSASELTAEQAGELAEFLLEWLESLPEK